MPLSPGDGSRYPAPGHGHPRLARRYRDIRAHLTSPLFRNAYALMVNTGTTGLLGVAYWLLAARHYSAVDVGRASAAYSAMNMVSGLTAANILGAVTRFIPQTGRQTSALVRRAYLFSSVASVLVAVLFLSTVSHWGASYAELRGVIPALLFVGSVIAWGIFTLQDGVLTGLRSAVWVPIENGTFGIVKIILLLAFAAILPSTGIDISWMLPVIVSLPLVNLLIFGKLVPAHEHLTRERQPPTMRQIGRFLAGDYTGALCVLVISNLVPIAVAIRVGPGMNAYFYMAWTIGGVLFLLAVNMATSLTVEGAFDSEALAANCRSALRRTMLLLAPLAAAMALLAPVALGLFGRRYAAYGTPILQLLAAATLPKALTEIYLGALRAQSRARLIAVIQIVRCVLMLGLALALTATIGMVGAALAVLVSETLIAIMIAPGARRVMFAARPAALNARAKGETYLSVRNPELGAAGGGTVLSASKARLPRWLPVAALCATSAAGFALFLASLGGVTAALGHMSGLGLISVMPAGALAGVTLLALTFVLALGLARPRRVLLGVMLGGIVVCLDGVTAIAEPEPRFPTAYWIAGFVDYVSRTGHTAPGLSAYFSWPGFFELVALAEHAAGSQNLMPVLRIWPLAVDLLCLVPLGMIFMRLRANWRARWLAAFIFSVGNWVGQDYFSPQSFDYLLYLLFIALLLTWFGRTNPLQPSAARSPGRDAAVAAQVGTTVAGDEHGSAVVAAVGGRPAADGRARRGAPRWVALLTRPIPGDLPSLPVPRVQRVILLALIIAIFVFTTSSHQLTPFFMIAGCVGLVLIRRCRLPGLPVLLGVIFAAWLSFAAVAYWSGHMSVIFGGFGDLFSNVSTGVSGRLAGSTPLHELVLYSRVAFAGTVIILAVAGLMRRRRLAIDDRVALVLTFVPFAGFALQGYGGEMALRVYLFALPGASILVAFLFFPGPTTVRRAGRMLAVAAACAVAAVVVFFVARYGNEAFEQAPPGEVAAMNYVYAHDSSGLRLAWLSAPPVAGATPDMPWQYRDIEKVDYVPESAPANPASVSGLVADLRAMGPGSYLITTTTQEAALEQGASYPVGWGQKFRADMRAFPGVRVAFANSTAVVYTLYWPPGLAARPRPAVPGGSGPSDIWTPVGLTVLMVLLLLLAGREFVRVWQPDPQRLVRRLTMASLPLLFLFTVVIIVRFMVLS